MSNNELQKILGARFEGHTHASDESVWAAIESQLDAEKPNRIGIWFWIFNGLAATLLISLIVESSIKTLPEPNSLKIQVKTETNQQQIKNEQLPNQLDISENKNGSLIEHSLTESSSTESLNERVSSVESEVVRTNKKKLEIAVSNDSKKQHNKSVISQVSNDPASLFVQPEMHDENRAYLNTRPLILFSTQARIDNSLPNLTGDTKRNFLKKLPIHLGVELSYLNRTYFGASLHEDTDSSYNGANSSIEDRRRFEFSFLSQFDLSKRFSAAVGIGYSHSKSKSQKSAAAVALNPTITVEAAYQRIWTIPLQAKFTFIQKKRIMISSGLTFQGEFGQITKSITNQSNGVSTSTYLVFIEQANKLTTNRIQQFALEPFAQLSVRISPRLSAFGNLGYRWYFGREITGNSSPKELNYINTDIGIMFQIR